MGGSQNRSGHSGGKKKKKNTAALACPESDPNCPDFIALILIVTSICIIRENVRKYESTEVSTAMKYKSWSSGLWRRVLMWYTDVSEELRNVGVQPQH
jgi:hypothetical protein